MPETAPPANPPANPWVIAKLPPNPPASGPRFGPRQAIVALGGFFLLQAVLTAGVLFLRDLALKLAHRPVGMPAPGLLAGSVIAAYVLAAAWAVAYVRRRAGARLRLGAPEGIAWCPAPPRAYLAAAMVALIAVATAAAMLRLFPVPDTALRHSAFPALLSPGVTLLPALALVVLGAPLAEEFLFRGAAFAAFAPRLGPLGASLLVTAVFVAVHAPEKLAYPPGFLDVTVMALGAAWLRLRYRSIRPAVVLHILYNFGVVAAAMLLH